MAQVRDPQATRPSGQLTSRRQAIAGVAPRAASRAAVSSRPPSAHPPWWRRELGFALSILALGIVTVWAFSAGGAALQRSQQAPASPTPAATAAPPAASATLSPHAARAVRANERIYPMQQMRVGLMQPAVDAQGNLWVGEMGANRLARLNPHTGAVTTWQPPGGQYN